MVLIFFKNFIMVLGGTYLAGSLARQNPQVDEFVETIEFKYAVFNTKLSNVDIRQGLTALKKIYGWLAAIFATIFIIAAKFSTQPNQVSKWLSFITIALLFAWISIKWCMNHRAELSQHRNTVLMIVFSPIFIGLLEHFQLIAYTEPLRSALASHPIFEYYSISFPSSALGFAASMSLVILSGFIFYYIIMWILTTPVALISILAIALPVKFARLINVYAPEVPFAGLVIFLMAILIMASI